MEKEVSKLPMDLKRAISLVSMPDEWFNTPAKRELLQRATEFIKNDKDMQTIFRGEPTSDDRLEALNARDLAFGLLTGQIPPDSPQNFRYGKMLDKTLPNETYVRIRETIEKEAKEHSLDYDIIDTVKLLSSKYQMESYPNVRVEAEWALKQDRNSALTLAVVNNRWLSEEEGGPRWNTTLEEYKDYYTRKIEEISKLDKKALKKLGISPEECKEHIALIESKLKKCQNIIKDVKNYDLREKQATPNQEHLPLSERRLTFYDINKREDEYYTSVKNVSRELGLNEGDLDEIAYKLKKVQQLAKDKSSEKTAYSETKNKPSYKTPTEKHELELDD